MKKLFCLLLTVFSLQAKQVTFLWDHVDPSSVDYYVIYESTDGRNFTEFSVAIDTFLNHRINGSPIRRWYYVTAVKDGAESAPSNVIQLVGFKSASVLQNNLLLEWEGFAELQESDDFETWTTVGEFLGDFSVACVDAKKFYRLK